MHPFSSSRLYPPFTFDSYLKVACAWKHGHQLWMNLSWKRKRACGSTASRLLKGFIWCERASKFFFLSLFLSKSKLLIFNGSESLLSFRVLFRSNRILSFFFLPASEDSDRSLIFVYFMSLLAIYYAYFLALTLFLFCSRISVDDSYDGNTATLIYRPTLWERWDAGPRMKYSKASFFSSLPPPHLFVPRIICIGDSVLFRPMRDGSPGGRAVVFHPIRKWIFFLVPYFARKEKKRKKLNITSPVTKTHVTRTRQGLDHLFMNEGKGWKGFDLLKWTSS